MPETANISTSRKSGRMLGLDLNSWNNLLVLSLVIGAVAAIAVGVSTYVVVQLQKAEAREANERIATLTTQGDEARAQIARANEKAEEARLEAARANERTAELLKSLQQRVLSKEQIGALQGLRGKIAAVNVAYETDADSLIFSTLIAAALQDAGITVRGFARGPSVHSNVNMLYDKLAFENPAGKPTAGEPLLSAFKAAGLPITSIMARLSVDLESAPPDIPMIIIGGKPGPASASDTPAK